MPRYVIPKGAYDQRQGGKFESTEVDFVIHVLYDAAGEGGGCEEFASNSNDVLNDLDSLGVGISVGKPLKVGGVDPVLTVYSAGSPNKTDSIPMVCEGYTATENTQAKMWTIRAIYRAVAREDPNHVEARTYPRPRQAPAWRIGNTLAIDWSSNPINPGNGSDPYEDTIQLGDIDGIEYDVNTQPRNFNIEGWQCEFSFVLRAPYYATYAATTLTVDPLWTEWSAGNLSQTVGKRSNATEWGEDPAQWWARGEWIVDSIEFVPINSVDHKVTVKMRYDDWQLCDQIPGQVYGGPIFPSERTDQPPESATDPEVSVLLVVAKYVMWSNPYPEQRTPFVAANFPADVYTYIRDAVVP